MKTRILGRKMRGGFAKPLNHNRRSDSEKNRSRSLVGCCGEEVFGLRGQALIIDI